MNPPLKLRHGDTLATLFDRFNSVIDYLTRSRIVAGSGIRVSQLPAGQTIESTATAAGGSAAAPAQSGMFRVTENGDGTVTVGGGMVTWENNIASVEETKIVYIRGWFVVLKLTYPNTISIEVAGPAQINGHYYPGRSVSWPLARLSGDEGPFVQLWQGGMIDFNLRYYFS